jgi:Domain of unknown function (DUF5655)/Domain of unknown function (DUF4287)
MASRKPLAIYSVHPSVAYVQAILANLPEKTGKSIDDWLYDIEKQKLADEKSCVAWLKSKHKLGGTTAAMITQRAFGTGDDETPEGYLKAAPRYVEEMYAAKQALRPLHDALIDLGRTMGEDVKICPCQTIVPLYREHVFAQIKPTTRTRIDLGLALKKTTKRIPKRLLDTGGLAKGDRITHRIPIAAANDIDDEVKLWLRISYDLDS